MIEAKDAYHNVVLYQTRNPITSIATVYEMIRAASLLGYESIDISLSLKSSVKIRTKLKTLGYSLDILYVKVLPNEVFVKIKWVTSKFIGDTEREIDG